MQEGHFVFLYEKLSFCYFKSQSDFTDSLVFAGYFVFTFHNPYLGNTCVPFQHWTCSKECALTIEVCTCTGILEKN